MPKLAYKHNVDQIVFGDLSGGINVSITSNNIDNKEMQECINMSYERDTRILATRGGLSPTVQSFTSPIKSLAYDNETGVTFIFLDNKEVYKSEDTSTSEYIGKYNGDKAPKCKKHIDKLFIGSGSTLQYYDYLNNIVEVEDGPVTDVISSRFGRLVTSYEGSQYMFWSGWGDGTYWELNANDPSAAVKTEIGGDGGNIITFAELSTDFMVFKNSGIVYQYTGYPVEEEQVTKVATRPATLGPNSVMSLSSEVIYINTAGVQQLTTTIDYGNITSGDAPLAQKYNKLVKEVLYQPKLWHLERDKCVVIQPNSDDGKKLILYNYVVGAATVWQMPDKITDMIEFEDFILVAINNRLHRLQKTNFKDYNTLDINWKIKFKRLSTINRILLQWIDVLLDAPYSANVTLNLTKTTRTVPTKKQKKIGLNVSNKYFEPILTGKDPIQFHHLIIVKAEIV